MWKETELSLGELKVGEVVKVKFKYEGEITVLKNRYGRDDITVSCGCTIPVFDPISKTLTVTYTAPSVFPVHLKNEPSVPIKKMITIKYEDSEKNTNTKILYIKGTLKKP